MKSLRTSDLLPPLGPDQDPPLPPSAKAVLPNGLRVLAVRVPSVPLVEMRVRVPLPAGNGRSTAAQQVLAHAVLHRRVHEIPDAVVTTGHSATCLTISGSMAATAVRQVLEAVTESLTSPRYDSGTCRAADRKLSAHRALVRAQPSTIAREALLRHVYGAAFHSSLVADEDSASVTPEQLTGLHGEVIRPNGAALVLVGDLDPEPAVRKLPSALSAWHSPRGAGSDRPRSPATHPPVFAGRGVVLVPRKGAVQSQIMLAAPAVDQRDAHFPALTLANCVLGGSFSSRLAVALREKNGIAYRTSAFLDEYRGDKFMLIEADTATGATARTLGEIGAELERLSTDPPSQEEIDSAREFLIGVTAMSAASQKGMAELLINALENGSGPEWLQGQVQAVRNVTRTEVVEAAGEFYESSRFAGVVVGDEPPEEALTLS